MKRWIILVAVVVIVGVIVGVVLSRRQGSAGANSSYELAAVAREPLWIKVSATGLVEPIVRVEVKSKASGIVERLPIEMGDMVRKGQIIAVLDTTEIKNDLEQGEAALSVAIQTVKVKEQALRRTEELAKDGLVSQQDLENARLELEKARSDEVSNRLAVANLMEKLGDTVLHSPIDGVVLEKSVEVGQVISSGVSSYTGGTTIAVIADLSRVYVKADVDESDIGKVMVGQRVEVIPDAFPDRKSYGVVERISPQSQVQQNVTTFQVVSAIDNLDNTLKAGMNVTADILVAGKDEALTVPRRAVRSVDEIPALAAMLGIKPPRMGEFAKEGREEGGGPRTAGAGGAAAAGGPAGASAQGGAGGRRGPGGPGSAVAATGGGAGASNGKVVCVKTASGFVFKPVTVGLSDYDKYEVSGLNEGDEVVVFLTSRALDQSREFVARRRGSAIPGLSRGSSGGGGPH